MAWRLPSMWPHVASSRPTLLPLLLLLLVTVAQVGSQSCGIFEKKCNGVCIDSWRICKTPPCRLFEKRCPDGRCVDSRHSCGQLCTYDEKPCPDGTCVDLSDSCGGTGCPAIQKLCKNGRCIAATSFCSEEDCPPHREHRCDDGDCYSSEQKCNGIADCLDNTDEEDCDESTDFLSVVKRWPWWVFAIGVVVFVLLCLIIALCCRYQRRQSKARRARKAARARRQNPGARASHEMPVVAGRRQQPVPTPGGGGGGGGANRAYQAVPTQVLPPSQSANSASPAPYNPDHMAAGPFGHLGVPMGAGTPQPAVEPSAPPLLPDPGLAPPPYTESPGMPYPPVQGVPGRDYLPSYETVQRSGPSPASAVHNPPR